jgi:hypothetical protein
MPPFLPPFVVLLLVFLPSAAAAGTAAERTFFSGIMSVIGEEGCVCATVFAVL